MTEKISFAPCIVCDTVADPTQPRYMLGLEQPYVNLFFHRECWEQIKENYVEFLNENLPEYLKKYPISVKK